jgi:hypothetical protein
MLTLDALIHRQPVERMDLIKIDVDGFEMQALAGSKEAIARFRPRILFEFDVRLWAAYGSSWAAACDFFEEMNYELYAMAPNRYSLCLSPVSRSQSPPNSTDVLAVPL